MEFEALAAECRSDVLRQSLADSDVWLRVQSALNDALNVLERNIVVVGHGTSDNSSGAVSAIGQQRSVFGADDDDDGLGYTIQVSRSQAQNGLDTGEFAPTSVEIRDRVEALKHVEVATSAFRLLRNACVSCKANQAACGATRLIQLAHAVVVRCCSWVDVQEDAVKKSIVLLSQVALQFLVNCVTGNEQNQVIVWNVFFPDHFQKVLVECQEQRKIVAFTVALILNCINSQEDTAVVQRRVDLVCARNLVITILQRCLVKPIAGGSATLSPGVHDDEDPAFEWICLLFRVLFENNYTKDLYNAVGAHMLSRLWSRVTPEQLILLRMLTLWVTSHFESSSGGRQPQRPDQQRMLANSGSSAVASLALFEFLKSTWVYVITTDDEDRPEEAEEERKLMWIELENEAKLLLLDALGEVTQFASLIQTEAAQQLLESLLAELQRVWQLRRLGVKPGGDGSAQQEAPATNRPTGKDATTMSSLLPGGGEPFGYRSGIIRAIGNLSFRHSAHQDVVREQGYLALFLNHCNIDDANPLIREWSLVALRNLCEGNEANQQYINALKPQSVPADAQTQAAGGVAQEREAESKDAQ